MSQLSKIKHSRNQWKAKAKLRSDQNRYLRKQLTRLKAERDQAKGALKESQSRLRQLESHTQAMTVRPKVDVVWLSLRLFLEARISFRAVCRVLTLLVLHSASGSPVSPNRHQLGAPPLDRADGGRP